MFNGLKKLWASVSTDPHKDRIHENARRALHDRYQIEDAQLSRAEQSPPSPMKDLPRTGAAWFLHTSKPAGVKGLIWVEVDDHTEQVTRVWETR